MAISYANIFMGKLGKKHILDGCH